MGVGVSDLHMVSIDTTMGQLSLPVENQSPASYSIFSVEGIILGIFFITGKGGGCSHG